MKLLTKSVIALSATLFLAGCGATPGGMVIAPSSPDCVTVVDGEYVDSCAYTLV